jgi:hypothetical protein
MGTTLNPCGSEPAREGRTAVYQENSTIEQPKNPFPHLAVIAVRHVETQEVSSVRRALLNLRDINLIQADFHRPAPESRTLG